MRYVIEFGMRGGAHTENQVLPTRDAAEKLARALVAVFSNDPQMNGARVRDWLFTNHCPRMTWKNETHFVAVSKLDGKMRGPASAALWKKPNGPELLSHTVCEWYDGQY